MNITKRDLCVRIARKLGHDHINGIKPVVDTFLDEILTVLSEGQRIEIRGFGAFIVKDRKARIGRNPRTGDVVNIPGYKAPCFKFSKDAQNNFDSKLNGLR